MVGAEFRHNAALAMHQDVQYRVPTNLRGLDAVVSEPNTHAW